MNRADLQKLAGIRIDEARVLLNARKYSGAYYLTGYAVECGLKACIARRTKRYDYPDKQLAQDCYTHNVEKLVELAGLKYLLAADPTLRAKWVVAKDWNEQCRYQRKSRVQAQALYDAVTDPNHGVLPWIQSHW